MFDIMEEQLVAVRDVPNRLPRRPTGKRLHISAVYRWIQRGVRGVRLEAIRIGGTTYTSLEALQRFADRLSLPAREEPDLANTLSKSQQRQARTASAAAEAILKGQG